MSRIEEALRRAGRGTIVEDDASRPGDNRYVSRGTDLEQYPAEAKPLRQVPPIQPEHVAKRADKTPLRVPRPETTLDRSAGGRLVVAADASPVSVEQYRRLAATMYQAQAESGLKSIMVCSALPREGKTLTAANLALTLSESYGQRVLLIDTDLRGASTHHLFGLPIAPGLGDFLLSDSMPLPTNAVSPTLSVVAAGTSNGNPIAGLVSDRMKQLVEQATARFDWVVLDTPPVGLLPDANLLARLTDAVVFVVAAGSTPYALVQRALHAIGVERVMGIVLNRASETTMPSGSYYQQYTAQPAPVSSAD